MDDWANCIVPGCPRKCCLALDSPKCFPHTTGNEHVKRWKIDARHASGPEGEVLASAVDWMDMAADVIKELRRRAETPN